MIAFKHGLIDTIAAAIITLSDLQAVVAYHLRDNLREFGEIILITPDNMNFLLKVEVYGLQVQSVLLFIDNPTTQEEFEIAQSSYLQTLEKIRPIIKSL